MKLSKLMEGLTPSPSYEGVTTANDMVLAVDMTGSATDENDYFVVQTRISEASGSLDAQTQDSEFLRTGPSSTKTSTSRSFSINGERYVGDDFQDAVLAHDIKYGIGQSVIKPYVYFNALTGKGEKGTVSITVSDDLGGSAGENASFSITMTSTNTPTEYTYKPAGA